MKVNKNFINWLSKKENQTAVLATTQDTFSYADYVANCRANEEEPAEEDSEEFQRWCADMCMANFSQDVKNLKASPYLQGPVIVTGTIGRWNGRFDIAPKMFPDFGSALDACAGGDTMDVDILVTKDHVGVLGHHHDATNNLDIWILKEGANTDLIQRRIDDGKFDPTGYDSRFIQKITDYLI